MCILEVVLWSGLTRENNQGALPHLRIGANRLQNHFSWDFPAFPASEQRGSGMASPGERRAEAQLVLIRFLICL